MTWASDLAPGPAQVHRNRVYTRDHPPGLRDFAIQNLPFQSLFRSIERRSRNPTPLLTQDRWTTDFPLENGQRKTERECAALTSVIQFLWHALERATIKYSGIQRA